MEPPPKISHPRQFAHSLLWRLVKGTAFIAHVVFIYQVVAVTVLSEQTETKNLGGWMTTTHLHGQATTFDLSIFLIGYVLIGVACYYVYWRMKSFESGYGGVFQYPLQYLFIWILLLGYGVATLLDSATRVIPTWVVLVILVTGIHVARRLRNRGLTQENFFSP